MRTLRKSLLLCLACALGAGMGGCKKEEAIEVYAAPKDAPSPPPMQTVAEAAFEPIQWTEPTGWTRTAGDGKFRYATIKTDDQPQLSVVVVPLNGPGGRSVLANVVRWEGQLKLPPSEEADLPKLVTPMQQGDLTIQLVDLQGPAGEKQERMLGALIPHRDETWTFLLRGSNDAVQADKDKFVSLVKSVRFDVPAKSDAHSPHAADDPITAAAQRAGLAAWTTPEGWQAVPTTKQMRALTLKVGAAELAASQFPKRIMSEELKGMNINRWRGQIGLPPTEDLTLNTPVKLAVGSQQVDLYDITGPVAGDQEPKRLLVAIMPQGESFWFFNFSGPAKLVTDQRPAFEAFLKSVRFAEPGE